LIRHNKNRGGEGGEGGERGEGADVVGVEARKEGEKKGRGNVMSLVSRE
jgi:hypothetical protein